MLGRLRPFLSKILNPIASSININPNIITLLSPIICVIAAYCFYQQNLLGGALAILFSGFLDVLDGAIARYHNRTSDFGALLDSTIDRFADCIIIIGLIFGGYCDWFLGILLIHSALTISYVKARAEGLGTKCNTGIAERAVRLIIIMIGVCIGMINPIYFTYILVFLMIISYFTVLQRVLHSYNKLK